MAAYQCSIKLIDQCHVAPPAGSVSTTVIPLTFFDIIMLNCPLIHRIFFYELPYPTHHFMQTMLPNLKQSLSLTLHHFFPFAAKLFCPPPPQEPYMTYNEGDVLHVTIAETDADFNYFVGNHERDVKAVKSLFPKLPVARLSSNEMDVVSTMAIQFTLFPNAGISIGITFNHTVADGRSVHHFLKTWATIHRSHGDEYLTSISLPYCNRDVIKDPPGLASIFLEDLRKLKDKELDGDAHDLDNVLITFVLKRAKIEQLKHRIINQSNWDDQLGQVHMSTYVVTCAFMWVNLMRLQEQIRGSLEDDDMVYHLIFPADCRGRFELSIPGTYCGNCIVNIHVSIKRSDLMGEDGIPIAAKAIGRKIFELVHGGLQVAEKWLSKCKDAKNYKSVVSVSGSPKFSAYETDFGWGRPKKSDVVNVVPCDNFFLSESREGDGAIDIGLVIGRDKLDLFYAIFEP